MMLNPTAVQVRLEFRGFKLEAGAARRNASAAPDEHPLSRLHRHDDVVSRFQPAGPVARAQVYP